MDGNIIEASKGMILTNGEIYGKKIYLADDVKADEFKEIAEEEYEKLLKEQSEIENSI